MDGNRKINKLISILPEKSPALYVKHGMNLFYLSCKEEMQLQVLRMHASLTNQPCSGNGENIK